MLIPLDLESDLRTTRSTARQEQISSLEAIRDVVIEESSKF